MSFGHGQGPFTQEASLRGAFAERSWGGFWISLETGGFPRVILFTEEFMGWSMTNEQPGKWELD